MSEDSGLELRRLVEHYKVSLRIGKHSQVADLTTKISVHLVGLCDDDLERQSDTKGEIDARSSTMLVVVDRIINALQEHGKIASAYSEVVEFVRVWDMVSFSKLVGAVSRTGKKGRGQKFASIDFDELVAILRKAIHLIRLTSPRGGSGSRKKEFRIKKSRVDCTQGVGFPIYTIDLCDLITEHFQCEQEQRLPLETAKLDELLSILDPKWSTGAAQDGTIGGDAPLADILLSCWFREFVTSNLDRSYPLDRFTLLVAILIVGTESEHSSVEQLIGELVDQIFHEETNSCNEEELMQLKQVGSFWLSYHKRYQATYKQSTDFISSTADEPEELEDEEQEEQESPISSAGDRRGSSVDNRKSRQLPDPKPRLRKLIDEELINGVECLQCGYQPGDLLAPLNSSDSCEKCHNGPRLICSLSFKPLELVSLDSVVSSGLNLRKLIAFSSSEWTRQLIAAIAANPAANDDYVNSFRQRANLSPEQRRNSRSGVSERVDIGENFERLTMIRGDNSDGEVDSDGDGDEELAGFNELASSQRSDDEQEEEGDEQVVCLRMLSSYARSKASQMQPTGGTATIITSLRKKESNAGRVSESLQMLKFSGRAGDSIKAAPICQSDVLLFDCSEEGSFKMRLVGRNPVNRWLICSARSPQSRLMFGCGRLFDSFELIRATGEDGSPAIARRCPHCECQLEEPRTLEERALMNI